MLSEKEVRDKLEYAKKHSLDLFITKGQTVDDTEERKIWSAMDYVNGYCAALKDVLDSQPGT